MSESTLVKCHFAGNHMWRLIYCLLFLQVMKESYTIAKPHIAEEFYEKLAAVCDETDDSITFSRKHLHACLAELGRSVMGREKSNFER